MKRLLLLQIFLLFGLCSFSQSVDEIKRNTATYLWGEGTGSTISRADQEALANLISQISVFVESLTESAANEVQEGDFFQFKESFKASVNTYSNATLRNADQIVLSDEPNARVFRYIKRSEIDRIFAERANKIKEFARYGEVAGKENKVADALRYYYWALTLLRSHPDGNSLIYNTMQGQIALLATWLHNQINGILLDVQMTVDGTQHRTNYWEYFLKITYKGKPAVNFDFVYWTGRNYSSLISARNGQAIVEIMGENKVELIDIKAEYMFEGEAILDQELRDVMQRIEMIPFRNNHYKVPVGQPISKETKADAKATTGGVSKTSEALQLADSRLYAEKMKELIAAIRKKEFETVKQLFTPEGYDIYTRILAYGKAIVIKEPELVYLQTDKSVVVRAIPMQFGFPNNSRQFVEDVVVHFNSNALISNITFGLDQIAVDDIMGKELWTPEARWILINFLENYKTAFALKRIEYIESIFDDQALIIVGRVVKDAPTRENPYLNNYIVQNNRLTKSQYIRNLRHAFSSNEFINIRFEDNIITKAGKGGEVYGIQIRQDYFSTNYGDTGYLFLMVDVNEPDTPVIHVRTWQPHRNADGSIYGLGDF